MGTPGAQGSWGNGIHRKTLNLGLFENLSACRSYRLESPLALPGRLGTFERLR